MAGGEGGCELGALILASSEVAVPNTTSAPMLVDSAAPITPIVGMEGVVVLRLFVQYAAKDAWIDNPVPAAATGTDQLPYSPSVRIAARAGQFVPSVLASRIRQQEDARRAPGPVTS